MEHRAEPDAGDLVWCLGTGDSMAMGGELLAFFVRREPRSWVVVRAIHGTLYKVRRHQCRKLGSPKRPVMTIVA